MMPQKTLIEWADYSSNPVKFELPGHDKPINLCVPCSEGCRNCYASAITRRFTGVEYAAQVMAKATPVLIEKEIQHMLSFRPKGPFKSGDRPKVFACDMTDLFGPWVPFDLLDKLFAVFALRSEVDWLMLTKRPERMAEYLDSRAGVWNKYVIERIELAGDNLLEFSDSDCNIENWPLPNVWLGTSVENQATANARITHLLKCPAAVRFVSYEPALGQVDFSKCKIHPVGLAGGGCFVDPLRVLPGKYFAGNIAPISWIIVGGESGPGARPCNVEWLRSTVEQCKQAGVPCFVKQFGKYPSYFCSQCGKDVGKSFTGVFVNACGPTHDVLIGEILRIKSSKGNDPSEWPADLRVRQWPVIGGGE